MTPSKPNEFRPKITVFHCVNALGDTPLAGNGNFDLHAVKMPCSSMTREVFLLRAFEAGADAVVVLVCPEGQCHYVDGNLRAAKRVAYVKRLVDEIGLDGRRLNVHNIGLGDAAAAENIIGQTARDAAALGRNPAA